MLEGACTTKMLRGASQGHAQHHTALGACNCVFSGHGAQDVKVDIWANSLILESVKGGELIPREGHISGQLSLHPDYPRQPWAL